jgi:hypothetical protein
MWSRIPIFVAIVEGNDAGEKRSDLEMRRDQQTETYASYKKKGH